MKMDNSVNRKIERYSPEGGLNQTAKVILALASINHPEVKGHLERVALLSEAVARELKKDEKAAFFGGLLHDTGKLILPHSLFDGHDISVEEYAEVKSHAVACFEALKGLHLFTALCGGFHHNLYKAGYGLAVKDFPRKWSPATVKKVLEISAIISVCDFTDAFINRQTKIKDGSDDKSGDLKEMLMQKYPDDVQIIEAALMAQKNISKL